MTAGAGPAVVTVRSVFSMVMWFSIARLVVPGRSPCKCGLGDERCREQHEDRQGGEDEQHGRADRDDRGTAQSGAGGGLQCSPNHFAKTFA